MPYYNEFKLSKYNYLMPGEDGTLILYNHLYKQLCKFPSEYCDEIKKHLDSVKNGSSELVESSKAFQELCSRNVIIPKEYDETALSNLNYMNEITRNSLCFIIYPTLACNFRCPYCYQDHENENMSAETAAGIVSYVRKNISKFRELHIAWFGGEPLLKMDLIEKMSKELMDICPKRNRGGYKCLPQQSTPPGRS